MITGMHALSTYNKYVYNAGMRFLVVHIYVTPDLCWRKQSVSCHCHPSAVSSCDCLFIFVKMKIKFSKRLTEEDTVPRPTECPMGGNRKKRKWERRPL